MQKVKIDMIMWTCRFNDDEIHHTSIFFVTSKYSEDTIAFPCELYTAHQTPLGYYTLDPLTYDPYPVQQSHSVWRAVRSHITSISQVISPRVRRALRSVQPV